MPKSRRTELLIVPTEAWACAAPAVLIHPRPIFRAALENLTRWTSGNHRESPPPSQYFRGSVDAIDAFVPMTDVDGHFAGDVRLPHVESTMHGPVAGAPLGRHTPLNPLGLDPFNLFVFVSGTFTRFSDDELVDRYESCEQYAEQGQARRYYLAASGYITNTDRMALIAAAKRETLPEELQCPK